MRKIAIWLICFIFSITVSSGRIALSVYAEEFQPGGSAALPAAASYENWMQFAVPDTNTPAIDADGCLNYALAKLAVRYNFPIFSEENITALSDSYTYYTEFTRSVLEGKGKKMDNVAEVYKDYLTKEDPIWLTGSIQERIDMTYEICSKLQDKDEYAIVLQMTTASGSDHYVLVDKANIMEERLYLLDTGSRYIQYLGDEKSTEKGYNVVAVHPFHIVHVPGDINGDMRIGIADIEHLLVQSSKTDLLHGDANHDGTINTADVVYLAKLIQYQNGKAIQYSFTPAVATSTSSILSTTTP